MCGKDIRMCFFNFIRIRRPCRFYLGFGVQIFCVLILRLPLFVRRVLICGILVLLYLRSKWRPPRRVRFSPVVFFYWFPGVSNLYVNEDGVNCVTGVNIRPVGKGTFQIYSRFLAYVWHLFIFVGTTCGVVSSVLLRFKNVCQAIFRPVRSLNYVFRGIQSIFMMSVTRCTLCNFLFDYRWIVKQFATVMLRGLNCCSIFGFGYILFGILVVGRVVCFTYRFASNTSINLFMAILVNRFRRVRRWICFVTTSLFPRPRAFCNITRLSGRKFLRITWVTILRLIIVSNLSSICIRGRKASDRTNFKSRFGVTMYPRLTNVFVCFFRKWEFSTRFSCNQEGRFVRDGRKFRFLRTVTYDNGGLRIQVTSIGSFQWLTGWFSIGKCQLFVLFFPGRRLRVIRWGGFFTVLRLKCEGPFWLFFNHVNVRGSRVVFLERLFRRSTGNGDLSQDKLANSSSYLIYTIGLLFGFIICFQASGVMIRITSTAINLTIKGGFVVLRLVTESYTGKVVRGAFAVLSRHIPWLLRHVTLLLVPLSGNVIIRILLRMFHVRIFPWDDIYPIFLNMFRYQVLVRVSVFIKYVFSNGVGLSSNLKTCPISNRRSSSIALPCL